MEPMHPRLRSALKAANKDLTDALIDQYEALLAARFRLNPEREAEKIKALDRERAEFLERWMPNYIDVARKIDKP